ncbi:MAG: uL15m family ribosomal protein [archaeon]
MTHNLRKKLSRARGSHTHGGGSMKKRRGAGHRGGRGRAGSGKRGDAKKPRYWKDKNFKGGKQGFTSIKKIKFKALNIKDLDQRIERYVKEGKAKRDGAVFVVDFKVLGYNKLLGVGSTTHKFKITVLYASKNAIEKIKKSGGEVIGLKPKKVKKAVKKEVKKPVEDEDDEEAEEKSGKKEKKEEKKVEEKKGTDKVPEKEQSSEPKK